MIKALFLKQERGMSLPLQLCLGPLFLMINLMMVTVISPIHPLFLSAIILGFILSILGNQKAFIFSLAYLGVLGCYIHGNIGAGNHVWLLGIEISVALGIYITFIFYHDTKAFLINSFENLSEKEKRNQVLFDLLQEEKNHFERFKLDTEKEFLDLKNKNEKQFDLLETYRKLSDILSERDRLSQSAKEYFLNVQKKWEKESVALKLSVEFFRKRLLESEARKREFLQKANDLRCELYQKNILFKHHLSHAKKLAYSFSQKSQVLQLQKENVAEKLESSQSQIKKLCLRLDELSLKLKQSKDNTQFIELKKQFEEKKKVLHETRKEVFHLNEKLLAHEKSKENEKTGFSKDLQKALVDLEDIEQENTYLSEENEKLSFLIGKLLKKQKVVALEKELPFQ